MIIWSNSFLHLNIDKEEEKYFLLFAAILCDQIWRMRDELFFSDESVELLQLPRSINHSYFTHKSASDSLILLLEHKHKWLPPPNGWLKFNFYASVHDNGVYRASVYRDSSGTYDMLGVFDSLGYGWRATTIWYITIDALERAWFQGHIWAWIRCLNSIIYTFMVSRTHVGMDTIHNCLNSIPHAHIYLNNVTPSTFFYLKRILTNSLLNYIIFIYSLCLKNFKSIKDQ